MATLARILVLNVYDLARAGEAVVAGAMPDQGLYGINHFERRGHTVAIVPFQVSERLKRASAVLRRTPVPLGDLDQQLGAMRELHGADLIYCPSQMVAQLLAYLRAVGALRRPLVWIVHHPLDRGRLRRQRTPLMGALLRGVDAYPALTGYVADELASVGGSAKRTGGLKWGPDPDWYPRGSPLGRGVVAAGW